MLDSRSINFKCDYFGIRVIDRNHFDQVSRQVSISIIISSIYFNGQHQCHLQFLLDTNMI